MQTLTFTATTVGTDEEYALVASLGSSEPLYYVMFQAEREDSEEDDDWGIHFEFNDQINSAYGCLRLCTLCRHRLQIALSRPIDRKKSIIAIDVEIAVSDTEYGKFVAMIRRVFRGYESLLVIADDRK